MNSTAPFSKAARTAPLSKYVTAGGPLDSTRVIVHYIVQNAFSFYKMGYASAMSMTLCAVMLAYTVVQMRIMRANENDLA